MNTNKKKQCGKKFKHKTQKKAGEALVVNHGLNKNLNTYLCPHCEHYHVGHIPKEKRIKLMEAEERTAYLHGAKMAAEYSKEIGKTDLALMTPDEILTLSECMCKNYHLKYMELIDEIPY